MAVQAQYPSTIPVCTRTRQGYANGNRSLMNPFGLAPNLEDMQYQFLNGAGTSNPLILFNPIPVSAPLQQQQQSTLLNETEHEFLLNLNGPNKRPRESNLFHHQQHHQQQQQQQQQIINLPEFHGCTTDTAPQSTAVSTGLCLAFQDDRLSSSAQASNRRADYCGSTVALMNDELSVVLQQQRDEMEQLMRAQEERTRQVLEGKRQQHLKSLLATLDRHATRRLREKESELERVNHRNMELEEKIKQLSLENRIFLSKLKNSENTIAFLRSNLQQAMAMSLEKSCGNCEVDDAESSHPDDTADAHARTFRENKELKEKRTCRVCRSNDVCILLLPCRHLCLCKDCEVRLDACPLCRTLKNASVQVYMS